MVFDRKIFFIVLAAAALASQHATAAPAVSQQGEGASPTEIHPLNRREAPVLQNPHIGSEAHYFPQTSQHERPILPVKRIVPWPADGEEPPKYDSNGEPIFHIMAGPAEPVKRDPSPEPYRLLPGQQPHPSVLFPGGPALSQKVALKRDPAPEPYVILPGSGMKPIAHPLPFGAQALRRDDDDDAIKQLERRDLGQDIQNAVTEATKDTGANVKQGIDQFKDQAKDFQKKVVDFQNKAKDGDKKTQEDIKHKVDDFKKKFKAFMSASKKDADEKKDADKKKDEDRTKDEDKETKATKQKRGLSFSADRLI